MNRSIKLFSLVFIVVIALIIIFGLWFVFADQNKVDQDKTLSVDAVEIDLSALELNNTTDSCWTALGGSVYDATPVIAKNPEYAMHLAKACGTDGTDVYTIKKFGNQELSDEILTKLSNQLKENRLGVLAP